MCDIITGREAMENSEKRMEEYRMASACERAFDKYEADLIRAGKGELLADSAVRWAVSGMFYGATSMAQLEKYAGMEPEDIVALAAAMQ